MNLKYSIAVLILQLTFISLIDTKNIEIKCKKYYTGKAESCFDIISNTGLEFNKFFQLNQDINCKNVKDTKICIESNDFRNNNNNFLSDNSQLNYKIILTNNTLKDNFNYYEKLAYKKFKTVNELFENSFNKTNNKIFELKKCSKMCKNAQIFYESIVNDKLNIYNFDFIKDINYFYGLSTETSIKDPLNNCL
eukprot:jgi/Orpsp1_1/1175255/evm.model.c7180000053174.1